MQKKNLFIVLLSLSVTAIIFSASIKSGYNQDVYKDPSVIVLDFYSKSGMHILMPNSVSRLMGSDVSALTKTTEHFQEMRENPSRYTPIVEQNLFALKVDFLTFALNSFKEYQQLLQQQQQLTQRIAHQQQEIDALKKHIVQFETIRQPQLTQKIVDQLKEIDALKKQKAQFQTMPLPIKK